MEASSSCHVIDGRGVLSFYAVSFISAWQLEAGICTLHDLGYWNNDTGLCRGESGEINPLQIVTTVVTIRKRLQLDLKNTESSENDENGNSNEAETNVSAPCIKQVCKFKVQKIRFIHSAVPLRPMTHAPETGAINRHNFLAPISVMQNSLGLWLVDDCWRFHALWSVVYSVVICLFI